ncbi:MAG: hypothetical protein HGA45_36225 [Chloroflexales bacterium]|nr:hypothetical protein [Chloroflexales bacterium]
MMRTRWFLIAAALALVAGLAVLLLGAVADPFAVPFQDYAAMPADQQAAYERQAALMSVVRWFGLALIVVSAALVAAAVAFRRRR